MILYVFQKAQGMNMQAITNSVLITRDNNILACLELYMYLSFSVELLVFTSVLAEVITKMKCNEAVTVHSFSIGSGFFYPIKLWQ